MYKKVISTVGALALAVTFSGCATAEDTAKHDCIGVIVDYANLNPGTYIDECIPATAETDALSILAEAGVVIEGTDKYPTEIVCRVNNLPSATEPIGIPDHEDYVEPCSDMPPEFAWWAVLVKKHHGNFEWAETGIAEVKLNPGESIALVFSPNGDTKFPG